MPTQCPACGDVLLNEEVPTLQGSTWRKSCTKRLDHKFSAESSIDSNLTSCINIEVAPNLTAVWFINLERLVVMKGTFMFKPKAVLSADQLPFFDPDLSDYKKLVDKIKTYVMFS